MNTQHIPDDDAVWRALAHRTRRQILDLLFESPATTGQIVEALGMQRHLVMGHLAVLREADLVITHAEGRRRINHLNAVPIQEIQHRWVSPVDASWAAALISVRDQAQGAAASNQTPNSEKGKDVG